MFLIVTNYFFAFTDDFSVKIKVRACVRTVLNSSQRCLQLTFTDKERLCHDIIVVLLDLHPDLLEKVFLIN